LPFNAPQIIPPSPSPRGGTAYFGNHWFEEIVAFGGFQNNVRLRMSKRAGQIYSYMERKWRYDINVEMITISEILAIEGHATQVPTLIAGEVNYIFVVYWRSGQWPK
jgi:hypothetical protein